MAAAAVVAASARAPGRGYARADAAVGGAAVRLAALGAIGALQWQDLVRGLSTGRVLLWVVVSVAAAPAVLLVTRPPRARRPARVAGADAR